MAESRSAKYIKAKQQRFATGYVMEKESYGQANLTN